MSRSTQIDLELTPYYHCISRCVRRAYLCGEDKVSGKSFQHRRQWFIDKMQALCEVYAIEVCAYAVMSNHYHLVLHANAEKARSWSDKEVMRRWARLCHLSVAAQVVDKPARDYTLEERRANKEDQCKGRFYALPSLARTLRAIDRSMFKWVPNPLVGRPL